jgi:hypothetical protein
MVHWLSWLVLPTAVLLLAPVAHGDGKLFRPANYQGSLEETSQEAVIIFNSSETAGEATEDLILKITVAGEIDEFGWVVPLPNEPTKTAREDPKLFKELFDYVEARRQRSYKSEGAKSATDNKSASAKPSVKVLSRKIVGNYDVAIIREQTAGGLNQWLADEKFQTLDEGEEVIEFYRNKNYVFACIKVSAAALGKNKKVDLHPLRFTFKTGGRDGIYFPMKMTGLQSEPFDVNLYVFYGAWLNGDLNRFGYEHRGFQLKHRDWDTNQCKANAGKTWSLPEADPYLKDQARRIPTVKALFQKLHPGERYYLTNIQSTALRPEAVRNWSDDLWLFPHYTNHSFVPYDARDEGPAATAWPHIEITTSGELVGSRWFEQPTRWVQIGAAALGALALVVIGIAALVYRRKRLQTSP